MRAVRIHAFGGPEMLALDDIPAPLPRDDELLVKVQAASVNPVDYKIRAGKYPAVTRDQLPVVLGRDVAGWVEACGAGVRSFKPGDPIYAMLGQDRGGYAEYVCARTREAARKPASLDFTQAAAVPLAGLTAWQGLFDQGGLKAGQRLLIHGGAGGVGHFAVQFAKAAGAWVATTVSAGDLDFVRGLGADLAIDYRTQRFEHHLGDAVDIVFDLVAGEIQDRSWAVLKEGGIIVSTLAEPPEPKTRQHRARGTRYTVQPDAVQLEDIGRLIDQGRVLPFIEATFPLNEAQAAQQRLETTHVRGKIVLELGA